MAYSTTVKKKSSTKSNAKTKRTSASSRTATPKSLRTKEHGFAGSKAGEKKRTIRAISANNVEVGVNEEPRKGRPLVCAEGNDCFFLVDGRVLVNLNDLAEALDNLDEAIFVHHASEERNDFANWVADILQETECAERLRTAKDPSTARTIVLSTISLYA